MKKLPQRFLDDMKELLMDEYDDFIKSYDEPKTTGLRINTLKINKEEDCPRIAAAVLFLKFKFI